MRSTRRVMMTIATCMYEENEDSEAASEIVRAIISFGRRSHTARSSPTEGDSTVNLVGSANTNNGNTVSMMENLAHNIGMLFRDKESRSSGELGEWWMEFVAE